MRDICGGRVSKVTLVDLGLAPVVGVIAPQLKNTTQEPIRKNAVFDKTEKRSGKGD
jgi:hypothetical protein